MRTTRDKQIEWENEKARSAKVCKTCGDKGTVMYINPHEMVACSDCDAGKEALLEAEREEIEDKAEVERTEANGNAKVECMACGDKGYSEATGNECNCIRGTDKSDLVNLDAKSSHYYDLGGISTLAFIEAKELGYHAGNIIKYVSRHQHKGTPLRDLEKALTYLKRLIELEKSNADS